MDPSRLVKSLNLNYVYGESAGLHDDVANYYNQPLVVYDGREHLAPGQLSPPIV